MKNLIKAGLLAITVLSLASCSGNGAKSNSYDSVATRTDSSSTSSNVDTMAKADTAKADTTKK
ncbi:entericidin [Mucilaginibacter robiniae]|uniref:Entericidin n=1 Tax=Mucilaginibacter robiniae TaxID=2728022 RepID=A0A7L5E3M3_9SPHI|nr:entericidin [Mucilaginibacter robiniae]QJD97950.1 entericidin [Mucilaginibacter robiniae]